VTGAAAGDPGRNAERLTQLGRQRAFAVGFSNVILTGVMWISLGRGYKTYRSGLFFLLEGIVVLACSLLNPDPYVAFGRLVARSFGSEENGHGDDRTAPAVAKAERRHAAGSLEVRRYLTLPWQLLMGLLLLAIALNFVAVGRLINATGGIAHSPFVGYAITMVVMGIVMAVSPVTIVIIAALGIVFFAGLSYTDVFGAIHEPSKQTAPTHSQLLHHYFAVTAANLVIGAFVTVAARPRGAPTLRTTGAPADDVEGDEGS
jgi:hypothetical protein